MQAGQGAGGAGRLVGQITATAPHRGGNALRAIVRDFIFANRPIRAYLDLVHADYRYMRHKSATQAGRVIDSLKGIWSRPSPRERRARTDRDVLQILATLPSSEFASVPAMAERQLQMLSRHQ